GFLSGTPIVNASISSDSLDLKTILNIAGGELRGIPLKGTLAAKMNNAGPLEQPEIYISGKSDNTGLYINNQEILFDDFFFSLKKKEKAFQLEEFLLKKADAFLTAGGMISGKELALAYRLEDLSLTD